MKPSTTYWIEFEGGFKPERADIIVSASPSIITSLRPRSLARMIPSSATFASTTKGPPGEGQFFAHSSHNLTSFIFGYHSDSVTARILEYCTIYVDFVPPRFGRAPLRPGLKGLLRGLGVGHITLSKLFHIFTRFHRNTLCLFALAFMFKCISILP